MGEKLEPLRSFCRIQQLDGGESRTGQRGRRCGREDEGSSAVDQPINQIARAADVGDATIYKYFPTKEKLVTAYFEQAITDALAQSAKTIGQDDFTLHERLQLVLDSLMPSRSKPENWPAEPPTPEPLSWILIEEIVASPTLDKSAW